MRITKNQAKMLLSLQAVIEHEKNIHIGYSCPYGSFVDDDSEFIIFEEFSEPCTVEQVMRGNAPPMNIFLVHHLDFRREFPYAEETQDELPDFGEEAYTDEDASADISGCIVSDGIGEFPLHDEKVEIFLQEVEDDLLDGTLYFPEKKTYRLGARTVTVTRHPKHWGVTIDLRQQRSGFILPLEWQDNEWRASLLSKDEFARITNNFFSKDS